MGGFSKLIFELVIVGYIFVAACGLLKKATNEAYPLKTVEYVDLHRYTGVWYEIARYPNKFQRKCQSNSTAVYTFAPNKNLQIENFCLDKKGDKITSHGIAKVLDKKTNAKLRVSLLGPLGGDYYIISLDRAYRYAVVGHPKRKYLWILSREKHMHPEIYERILFEIENAGYDRNKILRGIQN